MGVEHEGASLCPCRPVTCLQLLQQGSVPKLDVKIHYTIIILAVTTAAVPSTQYDTRAVVQISTVNNNNFVYSAVYYKPAGSLADRSIVNKFTTMLRNCS
ncbi:hypothetical protein ILYODFUR_015420 [Ilyodon furcidens]|uniref:Uncharacterized protein n=1 Tax=Ilyodon furcidens TaxID=33524 RepID=A0ABV0T894_9TELE